MGRFPPDPQCETKNASSNPTIQHVRSKLSLKKNQYLLTTMLNYAIYVWISIWVTGISGGQITPWQGHSLWGLCHTNFLSGPKNWVLWDATSRAATSVYHWFKMLEYCFFTILNKFLGAEPFKTLLLLKYDVFQAPFKRLRIVIKILFPTISLDCNYLQILSMILVTNCSVWAQLNSCHGLTARCAKWCTATWTCGLFNWQGVACPYIYWTWW